MKPDGLTVQRPANSRWVISNKTLMNVSIVLMLIFPCFTSLIGTWFPNGIQKYFILLVGLVLLFITNLLFQYKVAIRYVGFEYLLWPILLLYSLFSDEVIVYKTYGNLACLLVVTIAIFLLIPSTNWIECFFTTLLIFTTIHAVVTLLSFFSTSFYVFAIKPLLNTSVIIGRAKAGLNAHYSSNGIYLSICSIIAFSKFLFAGQKRARYGAIAAMAFFANIIIAKRAGLIFSVLVVAFLYLVKNRNRRMSSGIKLLVAGILVATILLLLSPYIPELTRFMDRFFTEDDITNGRLPLYRLALNLFSNNPIFGVGWGNYKHYYATYLPYHDANFAQLDTHNVYLQLLAEVGIVGFFIFIIISLRTFFSTLFLTVQSIGSNTDALSKGLFLSLGMQLYFLLYCFTGNPLYDAQTLIPYAFSCAAFYAIRYKKRQQRALALTKETV